MADYITLMGAEQVQSAANTLRSAAHEMQRAASSMEDSLQRHRNWADEWLDRFNTVLEGLPRVG